MNGEGTATIGNETAPIKSGDAIPVRVGETKAFANTGQRRSNSSSSASRAT